MAPILIDSRDLLKLGLVSVLVTALVFAAGFFMGHQRAAAFYQAGSEAWSLPLPEKTVSTETVLDTQVPEIIEAGEDIDVDQPEIATQVNGDSQYSMPYLAGKEQISKLRNAALASGVKDVDQVNEKSVGAVVTSVIELNKIKYSVQVGMYGRLVNAENMMKMLQAQQYDAYVSDYTNKKNEIRYNVRFGYFADKKSAIARLKKFKAEQKGDGYLVKFSADNIVNVARAINLERAANAPVQKNKKEKVLTPVTSPVEAIEDKISRTDLSRADQSQADMLTNTLATTN